MRGLAAVLCLLAVGCTPRMPGDRSGVRVTVEAGAGDVDPGVVFLRFDPPGRDPVAWAVDARDGLPASRTFWTGLVGDFLLVAAGFDCTSGCGEVDPGTDRPVAGGWAPVSLRPGRTTRVTIVLDGRSCGNGIVEPGEACDGTEGCDDDCRMGVAELAEVPGGAGDGIAVLSDGETFTVAWIDGTCGTGGSSCVSWDGSMGAGSHDTGGTTGWLASDVWTSVAWTRPGDPDRLVAMDLGNPGGEIDLGDTDAAMIGKPSVGSLPTSSILVGLAVEPDTGDLELRWAEPDSHGGSASAARLSGSDSVISPDVVVVQSSRSLMAVWALDGPGSGWFTRRWECGDGPGGCSATPVETEPVALGFPAQDLILRSSVSGTLFMISAVDGDVHIRGFDLTDVPATEPDAVAAGATANGGSLVDAAVDSSGEDVYALVVLPMTGTPACTTELIDLAVDGEAPPRRVARWGEDGELGCMAGLGLVDEDRYVVAWRAPSPEPDSVRIMWTMGSLDPMY